MTPSTDPDMRNYRIRLLPRVVTPWRRFAARRTRSSALGAPVRHCVRGAFCWGGFPLASPLPSTASAAGCPALFGAFIGTMGRSDFLGSFIVGVRPWTSRRGPPLHRRRAHPGPPGSRAKCFRTRTGSATARDPCASRDSDAPGAALRLSLQRRHPEPSFFRGSIPGPHLPCQRFGHPLTTIAA